MTSNQVTVITGAAGGLGAEVTSLLLERAHAVAALDIHVEALSPLVEKYRGRFAAMKLDPSDPRTWHNAVRGIEQELGAPAGAVLCAGGWAGGAPVATMTEDAVYRRMMVLNVDTAEGALRALLPGMVERRRGSIVVIGSRAVERPWENTGSAAYVAAKTALVAYARTIAAEVLESGVRVNALLPSVIDTAANRAAMPNADPSRWVSPRSLGEVIAFLLSDAARDVSGAAIPVYGRV